MVGLQTGAPIPAPRTLNLGLKGEKHPSPALLPILDAPLLFYSNGELHARFIVPCDMAREFQV